MKVTSEGIVDGYFLDKYGGKGSSFINGMPSLSIPFSIEDAPAGARKNMILPLWQASTKAMKEEK